jgi:hypothetical protein
MATHRICNLVPSRDTQKDWRIEHALQANAISAPPATLPASVDLRAPWWNIGDQESTGSCVGWGSTDGVARYHFVKAGKLAQNAKLSPRCTWMASKETDAFTTRPETFIEEAGTSLKAAVDFLRKYGAAPEPLLPFHVTTNLYLGDENTFYATLATRRIASYSIFRRTSRIGAPGSPPTARSWSGSTWTQPGTMPPRPTADWIPSSPTRCAGAMLLASLATPLSIVSSCAIAGARRGETMVLPTPARPTSMLRSLMRVMA